MQKKGGGICTLESICIESAHLSEHLGEHFSAHIGYIGHEEYSSSLRIRCRHFRGHLASHNCGHIGHKERKNPPPKTTRISTILWLFF